jgi:hypothetical protein
MPATCFIRSTGIAVFGLIAILAGTVGAVLPPDAVEGLKTDAQAVLEVSV